jgi:FMN phosphatase YigB (HAD superfamily)
MIIPSTKNRRVVLGKVRKFTILFSSAVACISRQRVSCAWFLYPSYSQRRQRVSFWLSLQSTFMEGRVPEEDPLKWERMYQEGGNAAPFKLEGMMNLQQSSEVRVVSFDLDNTLWVTSATISAANEALAAFLDARGVVQPQRIETIMGILFKENKERYCPIEVEQAKAPALLTLLRKDAIRKILLDDNGYSSESAECSAEEAFQTWTNARHDAITFNMAEAVKECLQEIAAIQTSDGHSVVIGAITDGNSDPRLIDELSKYFHFCVNAEKVGISKPDKRIYLKAVQELAGHPSLKHLLPDDDAQDYELESRLGPWWVHVGDDFIKDVVAAKDLNMRSVWARELVLDKQVDYAFSEGKPKRSVEALVKDVSKNEVVKMQVGATDYLVNSLHQEFADAIVDRFGEVATVLNAWHSEGLVKTSTPLQIVENDVTVQEEVVLRPEVESGDTENDRTPNIKNGGSKFCLFCGNALPGAAKFCSKCGEGQQV